MVPEFVRESSSESSSASHRTVAFSSNEEEQDCCKEKVIVDGEEVKQYGLWLVASPLKRKAAVVGSEAFKQLGKKISGGSSSEQHTGAQNSKIKCTLFPWTNSRFDSGRRPTERSLQLEKTPR
ncbi:hypothetical protein COLO4_25258 [Corchorus olitorius]|uniref:Uncharacterized protein n=1 Tax=Corchorus olitorius TaxID=93759 RepID=A0A1R3I3R6_9ROSI|nr:hypothetical protein COLO4_25258 [Corchorus olitorius]